MADIQRKTANLLDMSTVSVGYHLDVTTGLPVAFGYNSRMATLTAIDVSQFSAVTLAYTSVGDTIQFMYSVFDSTDTLIERVAGKASGDSIDVSSAAKLYIAFYRNAALTINSVEEAMLNEGSTAKPYEPYGWVHSLRKLTTATEAVENPLYTDGSPITAYTLKGNEEHTGTPSPSNPVMPNGVGNKTANLFNTFDIVGQVPSISNGQLISYSGSTTSLIPITSGDITVTKPAGTIIYLLLYAADSSYIGYIGNETPKYIYGNAITGYGNAKYCRLRIDRTTSLDIQIMLNEGSTTLDYEPYGYKIPISNGQTTTPIYLTEQLMKIGDTADSLLSSGTVNRVINTISYDGTETWISAVTTQGYYRFYCSAKKITDADSSKRMSFMCTHFTQNGGDWNKLGFVVGSDGNGFYVVSDIDNTTDWKTWLEQQKNNGTPLTTYYILETPTTETVTAPSIPTTEGANSITVDTTVQPSEFTVTWTGWHDASVKEYVGGVGNNKFDEQYPDISDTIIYKPIYVGDGNFTLSTTAPQTSDPAALLFLLSGNVSSGASSSSNGVWSGQNRTKAAVDGYVTIAYRAIRDYTPVGSQTMLNAGTTVMTYEPYEYGWV